jgi:peptidoglycan/LPS O-acetylase OafA/YrhL
MSERRYDLDWLRIIAFGMLILYHIGMFYVSWDWHVKSSRASEWIEPLMMLTNPWRLTLLFIIAGAATRYMKDKMSVGAFTKSRMSRLCPPLLLAVFVIVPPQSYYEVVESLQQMPAPVGPSQAHWLENFYFKYMTASGNWCDQDGCLMTPTYNHMWFVAYLIIYTLLLVPLLPLLRKLPAAASIFIQGPWLFLTPWLVMIGLRLTLFPVFGETHAFWNDWYLHPLYFTAFVFGFAIAKYDLFFERCTNLRWTALAIAIVCWATVVTYLYGIRNGSTPPLWLGLILRGMHQLQAWTAIVAAIGFAHRHLQSADGPLRRLLTQAIFPFYLIHQTIIVVVAHYLDEVQLPLVIEASLLILITAIGCWVFFDLGRRVPWLSVWIGLSSDPGSPRKVKAH